MSVTLNFVDAVAVIAIDDGNKNVINHDVLDNLERVWNEAQAQAGAILFKGRSGSFCAGYDISVMTGGDAEASRRLGARGGALAKAIYASPIPVVGLSEGHAFTIGAVWLAGCDFRIAERGAFKYGMTEVALGVPLTGWALEPMRARIRPEFHERALMHSGIFDPMEAMEVGFVDEVCDQGAGYELALDRAHQLATLPQKAYQETKMAMRQSVVDAMEAQLPT